MLWGDNDTGSPLTATGSSHFGHLRGPGPHDGLDLLFVVQRLPEKRKLSALSVVVQQGRSFGYESLSVEQKWQLAEERCETFGGIVALDFDKAALSLHDTSPVEHRIEQRRDGCFRHLRLRSRYDDDGSIGSVVDISSANAGWQWSVEGHVSRSEAICNLSVAFPREGVDGFGAELDHGDQREGSLSQAWMGEFELWLVDDAITGEQQIEIHSSRTPSGTAAASPAAECCFESVERGEERGWLPGCFDEQCCVRVSRLWRSNGG